MTIETHKIKGEAKSLELENGVVLTYCERGEQNEEVIIFPGFFFYTFIPVIERLAERYHVYGVVMRFNGPTTEMGADGRPHWGKQWGKDLYGFMQKLGIKRVHLFGKCHGSVPCWYIYKNHPEMVIDFCSFFLAPHLKPANSAIWFGLLDKGLPAMMAAAVRDVENGVPKKIEEAKAMSAADASNIWAIQEYASSSEKLWDSVEDCERSLRNNNIPLCFLFGSDDPLFSDYLDANLYLWQAAKDSRFVMLQGEKHLMEIDCPERIADEALMFIEMAGRKY